MTLGETIWEVYWEGPYEWAHRARDKIPTERHVLYAFFGQHHMYGPNVLLYIGMSADDVATRLDRHGPWITAEYDRVNVRLGSVGRFEGWQTSYSTRPFSAPAPEITRAVESLLIYAHQPAYNTLEKKGSKPLAALRVFNTGRPGPLLPEVSSLYMRGQ